MQLEGHDLLEICEVAPALLILVHSFSGSTSAFLISLNCNGSQLRHFSMMPNRAHDTYLNCDGTACAIRKFAFFCGMQPKPNYFSAWKKMDRMLATEIPKPSQNHVKTMRDAMANLAIFGEQK